MPNNGGNQHQQQQQLFKTFPLPPSFPSPSMITFFLLFSLIASAASLDQVAKIKFPYKPKPFYPIEGEILAVSGVAVSPITDEIYFCDEALHQIFKISGEQQFLVAGAGGEPGYKDGHLVAAKFNYPQGISFHPNGTLLAVADTKNHVIRIMDLEKGSVDTLAGSPGEWGFKDGVGSNALFDYPSDVAFDTTSRDALYVADTDNNVIRKIHIASKAVETFSTPISNDKRPLTPMSIYFDHSDSSIYVTDWGKSAVKVLNSDGNMTTIFQSSSIIPYPYGIVKRGNLLHVSDFALDYIVSIDLVSKSWSIFAGAENLPGFFDGLRLDAQFNSPQFLCLTKSNDIVVSDYNNNALRVISNSSGLLYTLIRQRGWGYEEGLPSVARFAFAYSIEHDPKRGVLYVADCFNNAIRRIYLEQEYRVDTLTGKPFSGFIDGHLNQSLFNNPKFSLLDPSNFDILYICDSENFAIRRIDLVAGTVSTMWKDMPHRPIAMTVDDQNRNLFISAGSTIYMMLLNSSENAFIMVKSNPNAACRDGDGTAMSFVTADAMIYDPVIDAIIFSDVLCHSIRQLTFNPLSLSTIFGHLGVAGASDGFGTSAYLNEPMGASLNVNILYVADSFNHAIRNINRTSGQVGTVTGGLGCGYRNGNASIAKLCYPYALTTYSTQSGLVFVFDSYNNAVRMIQNGRVTTIAGQGSPIYTALKNTPTSIASAKSIAAIGENELLLADAINNCIMRVIINGESLDIKVIAGDGSKGWSDGVGIDSMLNWPADMALSADKSIIYIADSKNNLIRKLHLKDGRVSSFAGTGVQGNDIKPNLLASSFNDPQGMALDTRSDILYVSDSGNNCIKRINGTKISLWAGSSMAGFKNGLSASAQFARPMGLAFDSLSNVLYVADTFNHAIRRVDGFRNVTTLVGMNGTSGFVDGMARIARLNYPTKIAIGNGEILVLDSGNQAIRRIDAVMNVSTILHDPDASFQGLTCDETGNIFISDSKSIRIIYHSKPHTPIETPVVAMGPLAISAIVIGGLVFAACCAYYITYQRRQKATAAGVNQESGMTTVERLQSFSREKRHAKSPMAIDHSESLTMTAMHCMPISIPGFLEIDRFAECVAFDREKVIDDFGFTATILEGELKDPGLVAKHGGAKQVAVKLFRGGKQFNIDSFRYEVMIMANLPKSAHLIELWGYSELPVAAILMKRYPMNLRTLIQKGGTAIDAKKIMTDLASGMSLVHKSGMIHFDLKPSNVLIELDKRNVLLNCVICDFGFANYVRDVEEKMVHGIKRPSVLGLTVRYAAPELFQKVKKLKDDDDDDENGDDITFHPEPANLSFKIEAKADVYAYAMTSYYVLFGLEPWSEVSDSKGIEALICDGKRPALGKGMSQAKSRLAELIKKCWSHSPQERPGFDEILDSLSSNKD